MGIRTKVVLTALSASALMVLAGCSGAGNAADLEARVATLEERVDAMEGTAQDQGGSKADDAETEGVDRVGSDTVEVGDAAFENDFSGDGKVVLVPMTFTNTTGKETSFTGVASVKAYQGGVELDRGYAESWTSGKPQTDSDKGTYIKPGASIEVSDCFELRDTSPVTVEVSTPEGAAVAQRTFEVG